MENGTERVRYRYDELNQLVREDSAVQNKSIEYVYDGGGNLLARKEYAYTTGELGAVLSTVTYGYSASWKDLLTNYNGTAITYDTIGNPLTWRGGLSLTWQNGRQLSTAQKSGLSVSYQYNASGIRTKKTVNGVSTEYFLDGSSIVAQKTGNDVIWYLFDGTGRAGFELNETSYYYVYNGQGDVIGILDSSGNRVVTYTYDSWGSPLSVTGSRASTVGQKNPIRYRGYYYDTETGLYYLQSRYYDPVVGRFLNADEYINPGHILGANVFAYCYNNPTLLSDPLGNCPPGTFGPCPGPLKCKYFKSQVTAGMIPIASLPSLAATENKNKLPMTGVPDSTAKAPNGNERVYGPDGRAKKDRDYTHPEHHPELENPHEHEWTWNGNRPERGPAHNMDLGNVALGVGLVVVCSLGMIAVAADDITGVGVTNDFLLGPLGTGVGKGLVLIFGG